MPLIVATLFARHVLRMNPVIICGALAGAMTVDAAVTGCCEVAESWAMGFPPAGNLERELEAGQ